MLLGPTRSFLQDVIEQSTDTPAHPMRHRPASPAPHTSGAIHSGLPTNVRRLNPTVPLSCADTPKSDTLTWPSLDSRMLAAFTSRCIRCSAGGRSGGGCYSERKGGMGPVGTRCQGPVREGDSFLSPSQLGQGALRATLMPAAPLFHGALLTCQTPPARNITCMTPCAPPPPCPAAHYSPPCR